MASLQDHCLLRHCCIEQLRKNEIYSVTYLHLDMSTHTSSNCFVIVVNDLSPLVGNSCLSLTTELSWCLYLHLFSQSVMLLFRLHWFTPTIIIEDFCIVACFYIDSLPYYWILYISISKLIINRRKMLNSSIVRLDNGLCLRFCFSFQMKWKLLSLMIKNNFSKIRRQIQRAMLTVFHYSTQ